MFKDRFDKLEGSERMDISDAPVAALDDNQDAVTNDNNLKESSNTLNDPCTMLLMSTRASVRRLQRGQPQTI